MSVMVSIGSIFFFKITSKPKFSLRLSFNNLFFIACFHLNQFTSLVSEAGCFCSLVLTPHSSVRASHLGVFKTLNFGGQRCASAVLTSLDLTLEGW